MNTGGLQNRALFIHAGLLASVMVVFMATITAHGDRRSAVGTIDQARDQSCRRIGRCCHLTIIVDGRELAETDQRGSCGELLSIGRKVRFSYETNIFNKIAWPTIQIVELR